jgi:hypothetical protein
MVAVMNIGAILEYGKAEGVVRRFGGLGTKEGGGNTAGGAVQAQAEVTVMAKKVATGLLRWLRAWMLMKKEGGGICPCHPGRRYDFRRGSSAGIQIPLQYFLSCSTNQ